MSDPQKPVSPTAPPDVETQIGETSKPKFNVVFGQPATQAGDAAFLAKIRLSKARAALLLKEATELLEKRTNDT